MISLHHVGMKWLSFTSLAVVYYGSLMILLILLSSSSSSIDAFMGLKGMPVRLQVKKEVVQNFTTTATTSSAASTASAVLLQEYMQLPAAQYACVPMPLNSSLQRVYGSQDEFLLNVPQVSFKLPSGNVDIEPKVRAKVQVTPDQVIIQSISCTISGSPMVEKLKLNERYDFDVRVVLTWGQQQKQQDQEDTVALSSKDFDDNDYDDTVQDAIRALAELQVDVYPPSKFKVIPRRLLARAGNMAMSYVLGLLLEDFLKGLETDYARWAMDPDYRQERMLLEEQLQQELHSLDSSNNNNNNNSSSSSNTASVQA